MHGDYFVYDVENRLQTKGFFDHGLKTGDWMYWYPNGSLKQMITWKEGKRDKARFWIDLPIGPEGENQKVLIEYYALRNQEGKYLGCLEASQNISGLQKIQGSKRLLD